eukprot:TRINITY_DN3668_c0_g3_i1.p1 TRINITY_DN3668_c0_g3~~TRINITY_DN3668_c0_g3_i1.p1  ORF type:complete len:518 (+),score=88.29 TRINITY_DN3668_c0_g3_i1:119-1672(+)
MDGKLEPVKTTRANGSSSPVSLSHTYLRWIVLVMGCIALYSQYYTQDNPMPMEAAIEEELGISDFQYSMLYTAISLPNFVLPVFGGHLISQIGVRKSVFLFMGILIVSQIIICHASYKRDFIEMLVGRLLMGCTCECIAVAVYVVISNWFLGQEIAAALAIKVSFGRLGTSTNSFLTPRFVQAGGSTFFGYLMGLIILVIGFFAGVFFCILDSKNAFVERISKVRKRSISAEGGSVLESITSYNYMYWWLTAVCLVVYSGFKPFLIVANKFICIRFGFTPVEAGAIVMIPYLIAAFVGPVFGALIDKIGRRITMMFFSFALLIIAHVMFTFLPNYEDGNYIVVIPMTLLGIFYAIFVAAIWPAFPLVVEIQQIGRAYGLALCTLNIVLGTVPLLMGYIHDATADDEKFGYFWVEVVLLGISTIGIFCTAMLYYFDRRQGGLLERVHSVNMYHQGTTIEDQRLVTESNHIKKSLQLCFVISPLLNDVSITQCIFKVCATHLYASFQSVSCFSLLADLA